LPNGSEEDDPLALPVAVALEDPVVLPVAVGEPVLVPPVDVVVPVPCAPVPVGALEPPASREPSPMKRPPHATAGTPNTMHASARDLLSVEVTRET
jgi:hypothetical protein